MFTGAAETMDTKKFVRMSPQRLAQKQSAQANVIGGSVAGLRTGDTILYCGHEATFISVGTKGILVAYTLAGSQLRHFVPRKYISRV